MTSIANALSLSVARMLFRHHNLYIFFHSFTCSLLPFCYCHNVWGTYLILARCSEYSVLPDRVAHIHFFTWDIHTHTQTRTLGSSARTPKQAPFIALVYSARLFDLKSSLSVGSVRVNATRRAPLLPLILLFLYTSRCTTSTAPVPVATLLSFCFLYLA